MKKGKQKNEKTKTQGKTTKHRYSATRKTGKSTKQRPNTKSNDGFTQTWDTVGAGATVLTLERA